MYYFKGTIQENNPAINRLDNCITLSLFRNSLSYIHVMEGFDLCRHAVEALELAGSIVLWLISRRRTSSSRIVLKHGKICS
ncbi:MAG: hypothetical protein DRP87_05170 [Spirochaetes bacterium]|nr:MAG: hypothetical protein DRP87_05170 [Spirochaetota bacterium]